MTDLIRLVAQDVRAEYVRNRRAWEQGRSPIVVRPYIPGARLDEPKYGPDDTLLEESFWVRAARFLLFHEFDPLACVQAVFTAAFDGRFLPWPETLVSRAHRKLFAAATAEVRMQLPAAFGFQQQLCRRVTGLIREDEGLSGSDLFARVLMDDTLSLSPLFRYCLARNVKLHKISVHLYGQALLQYLMHTEAYDKVWGTWIPPSLQAAGVQARIILKGLQNGGQATTRHQPEPEQE